MNSLGQYIDDLIPQWYAIRTQFRKEKYLVNQLTDKGIEAYVPIQKIRKYYKSGKKIVELPLIPNYAFVKITRKEYLTVLRAQGFLSFVHFSGQLFQIPEKEMETLMLVVAEEEVLRCSTEDLVTGDLVEIKSGQLVGMRGQLIKVMGKRAFVLQLERMGFFLTINIEGHLLRKVQVA